MAWLSIRRWSELAAAAARAGLTTTGYVGEAALAAARGMTADGQPDTSVITRAELATLAGPVRRTALNQAAAGLRDSPTGASVGEVIASCARSVATLDAVVRPDRLPVPAADQVRQRSSPDCRGGRR